MKRMTKGARRHLIRITEEAVRRERWESEHETVYVTMRPGETVQVPITPAMKRYVHIHIIPDYLDGTITTLAVGGIPADLAVPKAPPRDSPR